MKKIPAVDLTLRLISLGLLLLFLVFVVLKLDDAWDISYHWAFLPLLVLYTLWISVCGYRAFHSANAKQALPAFALAASSTGALVTSYLLVKRLEFESDTSMTRILLPLMAGIVVAGLFFILTNFIK